MYIILSTIIFGVAGFCLARPLVALWDAIASSYIEDLKATCFGLQLGTEGQFQFCLRCWLGALATVIVVVGFIFKMWIFMIPCLYIIFISPRIIIAILIRRRKILLRDQLVTALSVVTNSVRAGVALEEAIHSVGEADLKPLALEFQRIYREYTGNKPFVQTLEDAKERLKLPSFAIFVAALATNKKRGGKITATLEQLRYSLLENQRLERKLEADTAGGQSQIHILSLAPIGFIGFSYFVTPEGTALLFTTIPGQIVLTVVTLLVYFAYRLGEKITTIEF
ncbi:MAG: type II secretion system F family protein [Planctomycetaceae bacterium]|jgi:tight adherence protein B|nr:type II secretion system F family protein [Planctomycetaceae bacterium]